ncbi:hypothetical protein C9374_012161 [Naegleria lovaniensis]|uniref:RWP-RK domain-containing protein n=1 Tax=Naegleria lovaniensis TaxID=51637 RepID=A0AA88GD63_NAELO|nr:uncharacterized protein C9374_012161 [Naegleria lovaniensis]KAG2373422.1 hypothetical protein C9374_012161 [Naegleria lovaniensis]
MLCFVHQVPFQSLPTRRMNDSTRRRQQTHFETVDMSMSSASSTTSHMNMETCPSSRMKHLVSNRSTEELSHANVPYVHTNSTVRMMVSTVMNPIRTVVITPAMHACCPSPPLSNQDSDKSKTWKTSSNQKTNSPRRNSSPKSVSPRAASPNTNSSSSGIKKQHKSNTLSQKGSSKSKISLSASDLIRVMALPQSMAAKELGVSLSTLKRRFYDLKMGRWPGLANPTGFSHYCSSLASDSSSVHSNDALSSSSANHSRKAELSYIMNPTNLEESYLDQIALAVLNISFKQNVCK